jgi:hypothetical protein
VRSCLVPIVSRPLHFSKTPPLAKSIPYHFDQRRAGPEAILSLSFAGSRQLTFANDSEARSQSTIAVAPATNPDIPRK